MLKCLPFGLKGRDLLILLLPDVSPASVVGIFRELAPALLLGVYTRASSLKMLARDAGETSGSKRISRPRLLNPKGKHLNISADRESLNQYIKH